MLGWETGGGADAECEATDPPVKKGAFFYDADDGTKLGQSTLPRAQSQRRTSPCTTQQSRSRREDIMVSGNYQAGDWVIDSRTRPARRPWVD